MSDKDAGTPRVFLVRHGETTWSRSGHYTGITDLPLLPEGEARVSATAHAVFGPHKLIDPAKLAHIFVSPRQRARRTLSLLFEAAGFDAGGSGVSGAQGGADGKVVNGVQEGGIVEVSPDIQEWGYGDYEGKLTAEIRALRKSRGLDTQRPWDIWVDGTEGADGESPAQVTERLDRVIGRIWEMQGEAMKAQRGASCDVLVVAHGHILRAFVKRWLGIPLGQGLAMMLEPGGVCGLSYQHGHVEEPAVLVGMSFPGV